MSLDIPNEIKDLREDMNNFIEAKMELKDIFIYLKDNL